MPGSGADSGSSPGGGSSVAGGLLQQSCHVNRRPEVKIEANSASAYHEGLQVS